MSKKHQSRPDGLMYSTDKSFFDNYEYEQNELETLDNDKQKLRVQLDTKQRAGKVVTTVTGFVGLNNDLEALGKKIKTKCGTGGTVKDGVVIIQGDYKVKIIAWLVEWGYKNTK